MQNALASLIGLAFLLGGMACPQPFPPVPPGPEPAALDAGADVPAPSTSAEAACANLARLQCPEGLRLDCAAVVQKASETRITDLNVGCLIEAPTVEAARACGTVACR